MFRRFFRDEKGTTVIEYGLICALLVLAVASTLPAFGLTLSQAYERVYNAFT